MIARTLQKLLGRAPASARSVPGGTRIYAVGDIHGRLDLLSALVKRIEADRAGFGGAVEVVLLGDYIDRGPRSADVLDWLAAGLPDWATWTLLRGNHEQAMLDSIDGTGGQPRLDAWLEYGGRETLRSYGVSARVALGNDRAPIVAEMHARVPAAHLALMRAMPLSRRIGDYLFVHAGIRPGVPMEQQEDRDLMWIRGEFLDCKDDHGCIVVHGHSITRDVTERPNRIGIDTGAYATGRLTALVLEGDTRRYMATDD
ncbi:metallophosphoesterase family protein [Sphingoaurantiacus capsulatus]|uniref:Metallophosphoesterase family protein n=1 Tax=Sphingoaurantiacus capsulatus TaxID=1771310 RepID=A0ABV7XAY6_9SPHN